MIIHIFLHHLIDYTGDIERSQKGRKKPFRGSYRNCKYDIALMNLYGFTQVIKKYHNNRLVKYNGELKTC